MALPDPKDLIRRYEEAKTIRAPYENDWRMCAAYCLPRQYSGWQTDEVFGIGGNSNVAARRYAYDNTGITSVPKFMAVMMHIATPSGLVWHKLQARDPYLMKRAAVRQFYSDVNELMFSQRYDANAMFQQAASETYIGIGVYGFGTQSSWREPPGPLYPNGGPVYKAWPARNIFLMTDDVGRVVGVFRRFALNARQFKIRFPDGDAPKSLADELTKTGGPDETKKVEFVHAVGLRNDYDKKAMDFRRHPFYGCYICVPDAQYVGDEMGYGSLPYQIPRSLTEADDLYGYSPALQALPALGGVSAMKKTALKAGHKAIEPPMLANDDGALSGRVDLRPGRVTYGGIDSQGRKMVVPIDLNPNFRVAENMIADERKDVKDSFFVNLFELLEENPNITAAQVLEITSQKAMLVAPAMGRLQSEYIGPMVHRDFHMLIEAGEIDPTGRGDPNKQIVVPPEILEYGELDYDIAFSSPLAKSREMESVTGFFRLREMLTQEAQVTGNPAPLDWLEEDAALPEISDILSIKPGWISTPEKVAAKREQRAQQAQQQAITDNGPAIASVANTLLKDKGGAAGNTPGVPTG